MSEIEIWIDLELPDLSRVCTLFGRRVFETRPMIGETLSFLVRAEFPFEFHLASAIGPLRGNSIRTEIEEVDHYAHPTENSAPFFVSVRCKGICVATTEDAQRVVDFMKSYGFEIDPYGFNLLSQDEE